MQTWSVQRDVTWQLCCWNLERTVQRGTVKKACDSSEDLPKPTAGEPTLLVALENGIVRVLTAYLKFELLLAEDELAIVRSVTQCSVQCSRPCKRTTKPSAPLLFEPRIHSSSSDLWVKKETSSARQVSEEVRESSRRQISIESPFLVGAIAREATCVLGAWILDCVRHRDLVYPRTGDSRNPCRRRPVSSLLGCLETGKSQAIGASIRDGASPTTKPFLSKNRFGNFLPMIHNPVFVCREKPTLCTHASGVWDSVSIKMKGAHMCPANASKVSS